MIKIIKIKEIIDLNIETLEEKISFYKKALFDLRFNLFANDKKNTSLFRKYKKSIAKIKTIISQRSSI
jgi:large subunit ribosomal protein L29